MNKQLIDEIIKELNKPIPIYVTKINPDISLPFYATNGSSGMDIKTSTDIIIKAHETVLIPTGLKMAIPQGYEIQIRPRSGLSLKTNLRIPNSPGTIDSDYKDEIKIIAYNDGLEDIKFNKNDRIAQIVLCKVEKITFILKDTIDDIGFNREGGFGHTGT